MPRRSCSKRRTLRDYRCDLVIASLKFDLPQYVDSHN